ncbi:MMPL family transporter [Streptomyces sp. NPDC052693]|uniref:MMPL family transporter n=1 Tax=Streptomyces sp. NPDC052693 TaxID=3155814 RepID=UPI0034479D9C
MPHLRSGERDHEADRRGALRRLGEWCARHFVVVILAWLVALVVLQVLSRTVGGEFSDNFALPQAQSQKGLDVLEEHDPQAGGYSGQIVLRDDGQPLTALSSQLSTAVADLEKLPHVVHEAWRRTGDAKASVAHALEITARVITCAALIMVSVFAAFVVSDDIVVKMLGPGLAVSVLIDATVVRLLMVPAVMTLLGRHAWWTPRWLDRVLPHIDAEGEAAPAAGRPAA